MKVEFLSTGWALPTPERSGTSTLVRTEENLLVDCGGDAAQKVVKTGLPMEELDRILLTHGHPDHLGGLLGVVHASKFVDRERELPIHGPRHALERARELLGLFDVSTEFPVTLNPVEEKEPPGVESVEAEHSIPARSYRIEGLTLTGDTALHDGIRELAAGTDLLVAETTSPDPERAHEYGHMTPEEAGRLAQEADAERLAAVHYHPSMEPETVAERTGFPEVFTPKDLDSVEI